MTIERTTGTQSQYSLVPTRDELAADLGGDVGARVAAMVLLAARDHRDVAEEARAAEEENWRIQQDEQVQSMRSQASAMRHASTVDAYGKLAAGSLNFIGAGLGCPQASAGLSAQGQIVTGLSELDAAESRFRAAKHEADATRAGHLAQASERRLEGIDSSIQDARDLKNDTLDFLRGVRQTESQTDQAAIYLRG